MRLSVEKWILTTLKRSGELNNHSDSGIETLNEQSNIIIEQNVTTEQKLYQDESSHESEIKIEQEDLNESTESDVKTLISNIEAKLVESSNHLERMSSKQDLNINKSSDYKLKMFEQNEQSKSATDNYYQGEFRENKTNLQQDSEKVITITTTTTTFTSSWQALIEHLNNCLDLFTMRDVINIIEELIKLENYLNNEVNLNEREIYFSSQQKIIENLNDSLKAKLFSLSQSTNLFNELKKKLHVLLTARLSPFNLNDTLTKFEQLESDYFNLLESIKSKVKLKIARYEKHLNTWNEFDSNCRQLNVLFERNSSENSISLEFRGLLIEISNYLNKLKEQLSQLASVCDENKYFELKNLIILYEIRFKKLKEKSDELNLVQQDTSSNSETNLSSNKSFEMHNRHLQHYQSQQELDKTPKRFQNRFILLNNQHEQSVPCSAKKKYCNQCISHKVNESDHNESHEQELIQNNINNYNYNPVTNSLRRRPQTEVQKKKLETSDKSTFTVNEISTQTDMFVPSIRNNEEQKRLKHYSTIDTNNNSTPLHDKIKHLSYYSNGSANGATTESIELNFTNNNKLQNQSKYGSKTNDNITNILHPESDGKKLLLEAYLRNNNDQIGNRCSSSSSCSRPVLGGNGSKQKLPLQNSNGRKCETITTTTLTTTTTRESGIGTYNEDEVESLQSANQNVDDYFLSDFNDFDSKNKHKNNQICRINSNKSINTNNKENINTANKNNLNEDYLTDNSDENMSKKYFSKKYRKKLNRKIISSSSSSVISSSLATSSITEPSSLNLLETKVKKKQLSSDSNRTSYDSINKLESKVSSLNASPKSMTAFATASLLNFIRKICTLIIFLFPLFFLLVVYFFYIFFLNPSCCDLKRNYLFINIS